MSIDLDGYCSRIGYGGGRDATYDVLKALCLRHLNGIPFEGLGPLLGEPVPLDLESLQNKLVKSARGGYCFEQNGLFLNALRAFGFRVTPLAARVRLMLEADAPPSPLSHMALAVHLDEGEFLCDVGFGGQSPTAPLRLQTENGQETLHGTYRLIASGTGYELQLQAPGGWGALYRFNLDEQSPRDYEVFNWYTATNPASHFVNNLMVARVAGACRFTLLNREFGVRQPDGAVERRRLESVDELGYSLAQDFGIEIERRKLDRVWERLSASAG